MGTCIPQEVLGSNGIVTLRQSGRLRSLHLITHPECLDSDGYEDEIDLSPFRQLRSLCWKGPSPGYIEVLSAALQSNSLHLQELELDFVDWELFGDAFDGDEDNSPSLADILGVDGSPPGPYFSDIRVLSLTHVPIMT